MPASTTGFPPSFWADKRVAGGLSAIQLNDIWVNQGRTHTGLVSRIDPPPPPQTGAQQPGPPTIWITHASSAQHALSTNRFDTYFHSSEDFYR